MRGTRIRRIYSRLTTSAAAATLAVTGLAVAPAQAAPQIPAKVTTHTSGPAPVGTQSTCWGSQTIYPDGWGMMYGSASTICDGQASLVRAVVYIRERSPLGFVSTCGTYDIREAFFANSVSASTRCVSGGSGYTYWLYSEHYASLNGQVFSFTGGHWN